MSPAGYPQPSGTQQTLPPEMEADPNASYNPTRTSMSMMTGMPTSRPGASMATLMRQFHVTNDAEAPSASTQPGFRLEDTDFRMKRLVAKGGCGEVWSALQQSLVRTVAVKRLREDILAKAPDDEAMMGMIEGFRQEALVTASLDHPNIVPIHDLGCDENGRPLIAMKLVRGVAWDRLIADDFKVMQPEAFLNKHLPILVEVAHAVGFAHARGIVHRDLKPQQVIVGDYGEVQLMDWGLAMVCDENLANRSIPLVMACGIPNRINAPNPAGTPAYMAPEQTEGNAMRISAQTDIFLLGAILYKLLSGSAPYKGGSAGQCFWWAAECQWEPLKTRAGNRYVPPPLEALVNWAMAKDPSDRVPSAREFVHAIQSYRSQTDTRRESLEMSQRVERMLETCEGAPRELRAADHNLSRAQGLWADNPQVEPLRQKIITAYAVAVGMRNHELVRAILQADRIGDHGLRNILSEGLEKHLAGQKRITIVYTWLWGTFMMFVLILLLLLFR